MAKRATIIVLSLFIFLLIGCSSTNPEPTSTPVPATLPVNVPIPTNEAPTVPTAEPAYPAPGSNGYPSQPVVPTLDPYPANRTPAQIWILFPVGEKCDKPDARRYATLQGAMSDLTAAGIPVLAGEVVELSTCNVCGCPTEAHYHIQIDSESLGAAAALGWVPEEE
ncbi:MAG: hypothetical protein Kow0080_09320 [Candidatus Promineifilaceae bacterium]